MGEYATPEEEWHDFLSGTHPHLQDKSPLRLIPSNPRCKLCKAPFGSPGRFILARYGYQPWVKQPKICGRCFKGLGNHAQMCPSAADGQQIRGGEVEISMLFADVRGSSKIAREMPVIDFTRLMNRFYRESSRVLIDGDAIIEKFVGDEIVGLFIPFLAGPEHAARAIGTAQELLRVTGHDSPDGPWVPLGAGVHTGTAFVGMVGSDDMSDFTALGDPVNIAAHLASKSAIGEILVTDGAAEAAGVVADDLEHRHLSLKGHPVDALVLTVAPLASAS
ncbi:MAG: adenylate/guanylate cyclase domain-containing protein [Actinobacteria bacterium]|nr:MAG: adenylate/guanylate cyclase domain-containing protein [Actinomycetota bacterium]TMK21867.1 MAG: adenylate/guanylate cyclase domain-containing protein [Actinomycetota bacterium]TMK92703.1 MAG: adenylate/guanylate cyclase domain-containing protein [Actinomycetota bacterium]TMM25501.1 MAG: adenylate/guanylate cyclase domain-containing protein [Actinomycetota bacterium]